MNSKTAIVCTTALGAISIFLANPAAAQSAAPQGASAGEAASDSGEILVTARRREERLQDVPVAVTVVDQAQIRQYDLTSVSNIRIAAPQISLDRGFTGAGASIALRGVSSSSIDGGVEQSVLVDFDGMAISRGRIMNDALFDVGSLNVLKGPQALFFGKNSPGGVVSIKSAEPTRELSGYIRAGYEFTADTKQVESAISGPLGDALGARVAFFYSDSKGYITNTDTAGVPDVIRTAAQGGSPLVPPAPARLGAERRVGVRGTLAYDGGAFSANLKVLGSWVTNQGGNAISEVMGCPAGRTQPGTTGNVIDPNGDCVLNFRTSPGSLSQTILDSWPQVKRYNNGRPYGRNNTFMPVLTLNYKTDSVDLTSVTGFYKYDYVSQFNADGTSYSFFYSYSDETNESFYQELRATTKLEGPVNFAVGGHFEHNNRTLYVGGSSGPQPLDPATGRYNTNDNEQRNKSEAYSVFGQIVLKPSPQFEIAGGGRYTHQTNELDSFNTYVNPVILTQLPVGKHVIGQKSQNNFSPEATITWKPTSDITLYGAYKTGYLAGGYSNPGVLASTVTKSSLSFDEEKVNGVEAGLKTSWLDHKLIANLTLYRYVYKGLPLTALIALDPNTIVFTTQNAANTIAKGVEFETSYRAGDGLTLRGTVSYNDAKFASFPNAQCYTGQTLAQGCLPSGASRVQDLSGKQVYRAPKWIVTAGIAKDTQLSDNVSLNTTFDIRSSSGYYAGLNLNPLSYQPGYVTLNAGATLTFNERWSLGVIGRNLTNRAYATLGLDKPGGAGEVFAVAGEPRAVVVQAGFKF